MSNHQMQSLLGRICAAAVVLSLPVAAKAQSNEQEAPEGRKEVTSLDAVVVTGSRFEPRVVTESPTPIDSISAEELARSGGTDLQSQLKVVVPSFSTPRPAAAAEQDFTTPPTMRGLSTGQLLLLVNGKRRHTSGDLNITNQIGRGDVGYDFNSIPTAAIKQIEVLRDGAAAQYGSDAIAGVMNLQLDDAIGFSTHARYGQTSEGDGEHSEFSVAQGWALGDTGFLRLTGQYQNHGYTNRARPDTRQQYFGTDAAGNPVLPSANYGSGTGLTPSNGTLDPREAEFDRDNWRFGEPEYENKSLFLNFALPLSQDVELYAFGGLNDLEGTSYNFIRRAGQDETVRALHPDGYLPLHHLNLQNRSFAAGLRGDDLAGFGWDFSTLYGGARSGSRYSDSNNVSYGAAGPTDFDRGGSEFRQWTTNLDLTRRIPMGESSPLKVAFGLEYRKEFYELRAGELASYADGGVPILDGPNAGRPGAVGSQPGAGVTPESAVKADRHSKAAYLEVEKEFGDRLLLSAAARHEQFSDFGDTSNYKVAGRFEITDDLAFRSSVGTGFRAPNLAQSYYSQANITFVNGQPLRVMVLSVNDPIAPLVGASPLNPEESRNLSAGFVFSRGNLDAAIDYYRIKITDRIAMSSNFQGGTLTNELAANGFPGISAIAYLTNAIDTTTRGVDVTARYRMDLEERGMLTTTLAANFNESKLDRIAGTPAAISAMGINTTLFDLTQQVRIADSMPEDKITLNLNWRNGPWSTSLTNTRYGKVSHVALTNRTPAQVAALTPGYDVTLVPAANGVNSDIIQTFGADIITDLDVGYDFASGLTLMVGASNLLNKYPDKNIASTVASVAVGSGGSDNNGIFPYAYIAPYGTSGRFYYIRLAYSF